MKKRMLALVAVAFVSAVSVSFAQDGNGQGRPNRQRGGFMAVARTEDGKIDLSKLPEQIPAERKEALKAADKDGDGFLTREEMRSIMPNRPERGANGNRQNGARRNADRRNGDRPNAERRNGDRPNGPGFRAPAGGFFGDAFKDGKVEIAKLPEQFPQERKDAFKAADKDGDGFLTMEEMRDVKAPKFQFPEGKKPAFINDDNAFDVEKTIEAIKGCDKNNDGVIDEEEQKAAADYIRENFGFSFNMFLNSVLGGRQGFGFGPGFGGFGPGFGGPRFDRPQR